MAETTLVEPDVPKGREFIQLLERIGVPVKAALWFYYPDSERWRLIVVSDEAKIGTKDLYLKAIQGGATLDMSIVEFQDTSSSIYRALRGLIKSEGLGANRFTRSVFNGVYVEDAIVYRLT